LLSIWNEIKTWFTAQGGLSHGLAVIYLALVTLYGAVPAFTSLVNSLYSHTPSWAHEVVAALVGIAAFYWNTAKKAA
jgi:hypothetical protein